LANAQVPIVFENDHITDMDHFELAHPSTLRSVAEGVASNIQSSAQKINCGSGATSKWFFETDAEVECIFDANVVQMLACDLGQNARLKGPCVSHTVGVSLHHTVFAFMHPAGEKRAKFKELDSEVQQPVKFWMHELPPLCSQACTKEGIHSFVQLIGGYCSMRTSSEKIKNVA